MGPQNGSCEWEGTFLHYVIIATTVMGYFLSIQIRLLTHILQVKSQVKISATGNVLQPRVVSAYAGPRHVGRGRVRPGRCQEAATLGELQHPGRLLRGCPAPSQAPLPRGSQVYL